MRLVMVGAGGIGGDFGACLDAAGTDAPAMRTLCPALKPYLDGATAH
jgi:ketopantoate reductase